MAFTTTSPFSSSTWVGPSGCSIISPSQWDAQVVNNLNVLSAHDHSGSMGEGQTFSASAFPAVDAETFSCFFPTCALGAWTRVAIFGYLFNGAIVPNGAQNACIMFPIYLRDGTYSLSVLCQTASDAGIATVGLWTGATSQLADTIDFYANPTLQNRVKSISFTVIGAGQRKLIFRMTASNVGSNGYYCYLQQISYERTGD